MNKAAKIRERHTAKSVHDHPVIDSDKNSELILELEKVRSKSGLESYLITYKGKPVASVVLKYTPQQCTAYATCFINGRKNMFKGVARGCGYDKASAALDGCTIYPPDSLLAFKLTDGSKRWYNQLRNAGFEVWQTL